MFISSPFLTISIRIEALAWSDSTGEKLSRILTMGFSMVGGVTMTFLGHPHRANARRRVRRKWIKGFLIILNSSSVFLHFFSLEPSIFITDS
jgi:hypothetical protein